MVFCKISWNLQILSLHWFVMNQWVDSSSIGTLMILVQFWLLLRIKCSGRLHPPSAAAQRVRKLATRLPSASRKLVLPPYYSVVLLRRSTGFLFFLETTKAAAFVVDGVWTASMSSGVACRVSAASATSPSRFALLQLAGVYPESPRVFVRHTHTHTLSHRSRDQVQLGLFRPPQKK